jgi:hypothetical protein
MRIRTFIAMTAVLIIVAAATGTAQENSSTNQNTVNQQDIDRLKQLVQDDMRSSAEGIFDYHRESGDLNNRLDYIRYGGKLNLRLGESSTFEFRGTRTNYTPRSKIFEQQGTNFTAGIQAKLSDSVSTLLEAGATRFTTDKTTVNGYGSLTYRPTDNGRIYVIGQRSNVEESLLSATGVRPEIGPFAGKLVGVVMQNRFAFGGSSDLPHRFDVWGEGGLGTREGNFVGSNFFKSFDGAVGYGIVTHPDGPLTLLRLAYEFGYSGYDNNRLGFTYVSLQTSNGSPVDSKRLGGDGPATPTPAPGTGGDVIPGNPAATFAGVGGYFSPHKFISNVARIEAKGGSADKFSYEVSGFFGVQDYTFTPCTPTSDLSCSRPHARGVSGTASIPISSRVFLPITYIYDNYGPFNQQTLYARLAVRF